MLKEMSSQRGVNIRTFISVHLMYLSDSHHLLPEDEEPRYDPKVACVFWSHLLLRNSIHRELYVMLFNAHSQVASMVSSLDLSHVDLVNKTWKFGGDEKGYRKIKNLITNFPSCCITDEHGQPVSWVLLYDYCAMGLLYTMPEHRGKGHAKVLISTMARLLRAQGFPVYCFIEEENMLSYKLFTKMGFTEDPTYRAAWFEFNF